MSSASERPYNTKIRHGFGQISLEWSAYLAEGFCSYYCDKRHESPANTRPSLDTRADWRITDRRRTVGALIMLCLNIGVDPPDVVKTQPCARLEAWVDPANVIDQKKAIEQIGRNLQQQYETLSTRTRYKQSLDPCVDDAKRVCVGLRRSARDDRILVHYNGHGVPRPTPSGEIWVFNRGYTQYIPVSAGEFLQWLGTPSLLVWDCSAAGRVVRAVARVAPDQCIQIGACRAEEILPMHPSLPADLLSCCLTSPVDMAVKWFALQNPELVESQYIPGKVTDRRTPLGELNWIFTAITDTIAWSALPPSLFRKLFRQDLVVAALFRNFLLANRIMRAHNCHPVSSPALPDTSSHPIWASWDLALNHCLLQVKVLKQAEQNGETYEYQYSDFFEQQLTAFELWLRLRRSDVPKPPEQLPVLLQVLLSQIHRLRALVLLSRYLDLGPEAVRIALGIGFFIYVLKLLQSPAPELRPVLVFIWARIMAVEPRDVQHELVKESGYAYFLQIVVQSLPSDSSEAVDGRPEHVAMCCFILAQFVRGYAQGQRLMADYPGFLGALVRHMADEQGPLLRQWALLCFAELVRGNEEVWSLVRSVEPHVFDLHVSARLDDPIPEVRAAAVYTLGACLGLAGTDDDLAHRVARVCLDASPFLRTECAVFFANYVNIHTSQFVVCAFTTLEEEFHTLSGEDVRSESPAHGSIPLAVWRLILCLATDASDSVREKAELIADHVHRALARTPLGDDMRRMVAVLEPQQKQKQKQSKTSTEPAHLVEPRGFWGWLKDEPGASPSPSLPPHETGPSALRTPETPTSHHGLPLNSNLYDWAAVYFTEPQLHSPEPDEPGSERYLERLYRKDRNERILAVTQRQKDLAIQGTWNNQLAALSCVESPSKILFAQFEPQLLALANDTVTVYDWSTSRRISGFNTSLPKSAKLADARLINEDDVPLLLTAATDGQARIWRNYESATPQLASSWWLLPELGRANIVIDWQQSRGCLLAGGDARVIRVWDAACEQALDDLPVRTPANLTALTSDQVMGNLCVAGFGDGSIHLYDRRLERNKALVRRWKMPSSIVNVRMQRGGTRELVSGDSSGIVSLWDARLSESVGSFKAHTRRMNMLELHEHAPVIATASRVAGIWSTAGRRVSTLKSPSAGYTTPKSDIGTVAFHPHAMVLAMSSHLDDQISVFQCTV